MRLLQRLLAHLSLMMGSIAFGTAGIYLVGMPLNSKRLKPIDIALLKVLPDLLVKFKTDAAVTGSLTALPRYLCKFWLFRFVLIVGLIPS